MITIIIPAYNRTDDLRAALFSLEAQVDKNFSVLISDDCSTEDITIVKNAVNFSFPITFIRTPHNMGCGGNRRFAMEYFYQHATEYVMFLDSDDRLAPQAVQRLNLAITNNEADLILSDIVQETQNPEPIYIPAQDSKTWLHGKIYRTEFLKEHNINFASELHTNEDIAFNLALYAFNPVSYFLNERLYFWRQVEGSETHQTMKLKRCQSCDYIDGIYRAFQYYDKDQLLPPMLANSILMCYVYWQRAVIYKTLQDYHERRMRKMVHHPSVQEMIVKIDATQLAMPQWCMDGASLKFFGQTFGTWIMKFFTSEELQEMTVKYGNKYKDLD